MLRSPLRAMVWLLLAAGSILPAQPGLVLIVNAESGVTRISPEEARDLFLGRQKRLASGLPVAPVEQAFPPSVRARFYQTLANKGLAEINAYWARLFFTGQAHQPRQAPSAEDVIRSVAADPGSIGLLEAGKGDHRVRVVLTMD